MDLGLWRVPENLRIDRVVIEERAAIITLATTGDTARCPVCRHPSSKTHRYSMRSLADLPSGDLPVTLRVRTRHFHCQNPCCSRKLFSERLDIARAYARRTERLRLALLEIGFALGGEAGSRLAGELRMPISGDTLLNLMRTAPSPEVEGPKVLGVDDWAWRKRHRYGTILVDLEHHRPIDLLPDASVESFTHWLSQHPGVEVISRDRGAIYADGASRGAPGAVQVADRWHLTKNLGDALEELFNRNRSHLPEIGRITAGNASQAGGILSGLGRWDLESGTSPLAASPEQKAKQKSRREERLQRYRRLMELRERGATIKDAARSVGIGERTANRWIAAAGFPERRVRRRSYRELDEHEEYIRKRWEEGCHNRTQIWREVCEQGYSGPKHSIYRYILRLRKGLLATTRDPAPKLHILRASEPQLAPRRASWLLLRDEDALDDAQREQLAELLRVCPDASIAHQLTRRFLRMLRERKSGDLDRWLGEARGSGPSELESFAEGVRRDYAAVRAALSLPHSNGQTEGQVNRLKLIKRQGYGRAGFELLRCRVLHPSRRLHPTLASESEAERCGLCASRF